MARNLPLLMPRLLEHPVLSYCLSHQVGKWAVSHKDIMTKENSFPVRTTKPGKGKAPESDFSA